MKNFDIITDDRKNHSDLVLKGLLVGILTSFVVVLYRFALSYAEELSFFIYSFIKARKYLILVWFIILIILAFLIGKLIDKEPYISGSGIPQVKGIMGGYIKNRPFSIILNKFIGGTLCIISGLSLGREGPSIQLGTCVGDIISKKFKSTRLERRLLLSSGATAGLAAAFNAPLSGVLFSLEEIYKYFSPLVLISTITSAVAADFISKQFFGLKPIFNFTTSSVMPLSNYWLLIILGILLGVFGSYYNYLTLKTQDLYSKLKCSTSIKLMIPFLLAGILGLLFPVVLCGGHAIVEELTLTSALSLILLMLVAKFLFSIISFITSFNGKEVSLLIFEISFGSGAPGGIFFPLLIIGGTFGAVFGYISINYLGISSELFNNFIIISMAGYFTAIVRAPITGIILITEMTGSFSNLLSLSIVSIISYIIADALKSEPIYDSLLKNLLTKNNINEYHNTSNKKIIITNVVHFGSKIEKVTLNSLKLPENMLIVSIKRDERSIVPKGNTIIKAGDTILTMTDLKDEWKVRELMESLTTKE